MRRPNMVGIGVCNMPPGFEHTRHRLPSYACKTLTFFGRRRRRYEQHGLSTKQNKKQGLVALERRVVIEVQFQVPAARILPR